MMFLVKTLKKVAIRLMLLLEQFFSMGEKDDFINSSTSIRITVIHSY
jgi:hypothetical protein